MIAEDLLLLALHDKKGGKESGIQALEYGLPGALIVDLRLKNRIELKEDKIVVIDRQSTGNELLDEALQLIAESEKERKAKYWIQEITIKIKNLQTRLSDRLVAEGILIKRKEKFLGIFTRYRYPSINPNHEVEIREEIHSILLHDKEPDERIALLISLISACKILPLIFPNKSERKIAKKRAEAIISSDIIGKSIKETIDEIIAALMLLVIRAAVL
ncbi:MAG: GOLPH3/VPS74 family protein [Candidatus Hodarchaeales archaeon]|jgi:hypothetical protein